MAFFVFNDVNLKYDLCVVQATLSGKSWQDALGSQLFPEPSSGGAWPPSPVYSHPATQAERWRGGGPHSGRGW